MCRIGRMDIEEILARLQADPPEGGYSRDDINVIIKAYTDGSLERQSLVENSAARVQQLELDNKVKDEEITRWKAKNFDLMMQVPGIVQPKPSEPDQGPMGIDALFERK